MKRDDTWEFAFFKWYSFQESQADFRFCSINECEKQFLDSAAYQLHLVAKKVW